MAIKICVVASGSSGNCIYVASAETQLLIDAGLSGRETLRRFKEMGIDLSGIAAICVTHEHADHCAALRVLHQRHGVALYANAGTIEAIERGEAPGTLAWQVFTTGAPFLIGDVRVEPFPVPHDAYDPVGFVLSVGDTRVGVVTDMGMATTVVRERLKGCRAVVMEANYDEEMLRNSKRPWSLKQRIMGRQGHMSNAQAGELLAEIAGPDLRHVFLAHISSDCNRPESAAAAVRRALDAAGHAHVEIQLTFADRPSVCADV
ncbi:MAG: MBL fold metallo-hydrolase [Verrucomicrobia bacterium]|nr:MBL fold metallo-hydrolase [Verrucomicrobiota bacterium]